MQLEEARMLFREYEKELDADLCFQSFEEELKNPLYKYGLPNGSLILAYWNNQLAGCIALQPLENGNCEMKRLFVRPSFRKHKIGEALVDEILQKATAIGYTKMKLDTLERLQAAIHLYKKNGFQVTTAYYENPLQQVVYMEKSLV
ncbi:MAG: GNAT family N-acetyltransferase [Chitinophagaceae bacterium]|nr:GNAT family N-acetyltransferase [Chitinophagaceae bacterium]